LLYFIACRSKRPRVISIVSETLPHLKRGCIRDFKAMLEADGQWDDGAWNATDFIYRIGQCSIEFFSCDAPGRVNGPARDILYINECINVRYEVYRQLATRTREKIFLDYNPVRAFWVDDRVLPLDGVRLIKSTYKDNGMLTAAQIDEIERQGALDPNFKRVYIDGETGIYEGLVLQGWDIVAGLPPQAERKREWLGLDFGYNDPTACMHIVQARGEVWHDEAIFERGLDNPGIASRIKAAGLDHLTVVADSAEPKSIAELRNLGLTVVAADKGNDSIRLGLQIMARYAKHFTARSAGAIAENRLYCYAQDADGRYTGKPVDRDNHSIDAARYVYLKYLGETVTPFDYTFINKR
jgi:phage terminase large subunit